MPVTTSAPDCQGPTISTGSPPARRCAWPIRFDETSLWPGETGLRLNPSILADGAGYLFAVRSSWARSDIVVGRLDADFRQAGPPHRLRLEHPDGDDGREDPRLFRVQGQPHVTFIGQSRRTGRYMQNQLFARLSADGLQVDAEFAPQYAGRHRWEKNWSFFEHGDGLYAVYSFRPCRILKIDGNAATLAYETPTRSTWRGGEIRGGAAPVRVGDELWCFTHDRIFQCGHFVYRTGLVTLERQPPFGVRRIIDQPILVADRRTKPVNHYASVVFACGALRHGDDWIVAHGVHDRWSELHRFSHAELESRLVSVPGREGR